MFICYECARKSLTKEAREFPFPESYGRCELCERYRLCMDVSSGLDWAWKRENKTKKKGQQQ